MKKDDQIDFLTLHMNHIFFEAITHFLSLYPTHPQIDAVRESLKRGIQKLDETQDYMRAMRKKGTTDQ